MQHSPTIQVTSVRQNLALKDTQAFFLLNILHKYIAALVSVQTYENKYCEV